MRYDLVFIAVYSGVILLLALRYILNIVKIMLYTISLIEGKPIPEDFMILHPKRGRRGVKRIITEELRKKFKGMM